ncbi:mitochondrial outer membrane protein IML2 [Ceratobasidium sp. AG-Ba]|nr:mitochondrial outer membrane protein IML2 [Ceratobasidium sp. AG-Ba]QRV89583.1 mitochondrial outer membrane protein IML2 [Ceratobasidium sp. AG-Ba]
MTYNGVVLLLTGWQADEERVVRQYREILQSVEYKYPYGSLWLLNRAKLERMTFNPSKAIEILRDGLSAERPVKFRQADALLLFELSWTLLADRRYEEAAESFLKIKELNSWSHATYTFIAAGCYLSLAKEKPEFKAKARAALDLVPQLLDRKKIGGRDLPTEVFIQKKIDFYKRKQVRRAGPGTESDYIDSIFVSPAEAYPVVWNTHCRITTAIAQAHISNLVVLSPVISTASGSFTQEKTETTAELDTADEIAVRHLLLANVEGKWSGQVSKFELAVTDLREVPANASRDRWSQALKAATTHLDQAAARGGANVDLSSRLDSRIALLRDEIECKMQALGLK